MIHVVFGPGIDPLVTLDMPCVCWSEQYPLRPTVVDDNFSLWKYVDVTVHK
jgi:hypothetical protein